MFLHDFPHAVGVFQEIDVHDLIDFVGVDALEEHLCGDVFYVRLGCGDGGDTAARKGDLGRGREGIDAVHRARLACDVEYVLELVVLIVEAVHHIGVVPEDAEVACRGLHGGEPLHHAVREGDAGGIGIFRHAPDALDGIILSHESLDDVHIGTVLLHADGDHLDAELLAYGEVAVIAGGGTDELHLFEVVPGSAAEDSELLCEMHEGVHKVETAAVAYEHFLAFHAEQLRKKSLARLGAAEVAVIARVRGLGRIVVTPRIPEHGHGDLQLFLGRSAASHVHISALFDQLFEAFLLIVEQCFEFLNGKRLIIHDPPVPHERRTAPARGFSIILPQNPAERKRHFLSRPRCRRAPGCVWASPKNRNCGAKRSRCTACS